VLEYLIVSWPPSLELLQIVARCLCRHFEW